MNDPRLRKAPPCVCRHSEFIHGDRCLAEGCDCIGYWPGDVPPQVKAATTRPVAR